MKKRRVRFLGHFIVHKDNEKFLGELGFIDLRTMKQKTRADRITLNQYLNKLISLDRDLDITKDSKSKSHVSFKMAILKKEIGEHNAEIDQIRQKIEDKANKIREMKKIIQEAK